MSRAVREFYRKLWQKKLAGQHSEEELGIRQLAALGGLEKGASLLDVGCGDGRLLAALGNRYGRRFGYELEPLAAVRALGVCDGVVVGNVDDGGLPFADGAFAAVTCLDVVEHVFEPTALLSELSRVLEPGGLLVVTTPNIRFWRHLVSCACGRFPRTSTDDFGYDGGHIHYFTSADILDQLGKVGSWDAQSLGVFGHQSFRHRAVTVMLGRGFAREFLAPGVLVVARKLSSSA